MTALLDRYGAVPDRYKSLLRQQADYELADLEAKSTTPASTPLIPNSQMLLKAIQPREQAPAPTNPDLSVLERIKTSLPQNATATLQSAAGKATQGAKQGFDQAKQLIVDALKNEGITDPKAIAYALATVEHETAGTFKPIAEYNGREQARKHGYGGGENYYGRGFIQLTHDSNYRTFGKRLGLGDQLVQNPDLALDPEVSAKILAAFFKDRGVADAAAKGDFIGARKPVNGTDQAQKIAQRALYYLENM